MTRVNADHVRPGLARTFNKIITVGAIPHLGRVPTPHQDVSRVQPILALVAGDERAIDGGRGQVGGGPGVGVVDSQAAAVQVHQAAGHMRAVELVITARAIWNK